MRRRTVPIGLHELIKTSKVNQKDIANAMKISPQWLSALLAKDPDDLTINQLRAIVRCIGLELSLYIEVKV